MAAGDAVVSWASVAANGTVDVKPGTGIEWLIHTLLSESGKSVEVYLTDPGSPTTFTLVETITGGSVHSLTFRLTENYWMRLKNIDAAARYVGYQGVVTK